MKVSKLNVGMLLVPKPGYSWLEIPWNGTDGSTSCYLSTVRNGTETLQKSEPVLYLGTNLQSSVLPTPGSQVVLAWGSKMTVDPTAWRNIEVYAISSSGKKA